MLYRLVRPMKRKGSANPQFAQRIPADVKTRSIGLKLEVPVGEDFVPVTISATAQAVRFSLRASEPSEVRRRQAQAVTYLEGVWQALRQDVPEVLSHAQIVAMSKAAYDGWGSLADLDPDLATMDAESAWSGAESNGYHANALARLEAGHDATGLSLEQVGLRIADGILARHGKVNVAESSRQFLGREALRALKDGFERGDRETAGDFTPDPKASRFPKLDLTPSPASARNELRNEVVSLTGLVESWWIEAKASGRTQSTYESYRSTVGRLVEFLKHDNAALVTPADIIAFKDHRLAKGVSSKTVGDSDIAGLRVIFKWAVGNLKLPSNPAEKVVVQRSKAVRLRGKSFTPEETKAILTHASSHDRGQQQPRTFAAKRWVPWLCAYTGARVGEMVQLRKLDVRREGDKWIVTITPEAGTVKDKERREVVLHEHLVELGFPAFVGSSKEGYLFLTPRKDGEVRGVWRSVKNRLSEFAREVVKDPEVAPNHAWRHTFKTIGREAGIADSVLDAICGHAPSTIGGTYGGVSLKTQKDAFAKFPRFETEGKP